MRGVALVDIEALKESEGNIVGAVNCFQDITERKHNEEAAQRLAAIIESSDDAIVSNDLAGIITTWNGGAERIFGYLAEEIIGKPITILSPPDHQKEEETITGRIRRGQRVEHYETVRDALTAECSAVASARASRTVFSSTPRCARAVTTS
jgi:PAS domain-containing protein